MSAADAAEIVRLGAHEIASRVAAGEWRAADVADAFLGRIRATDGAVKAYLTVDEKAARAEAEAVDRKRASGAPLGPLAGVPVAVKDNMCTRGLRTTAASRILEKYVPPYDCTAVKRLRDAGAVVLGKTNLDEFAMGSSTENSAFQVTRNPWDLSRVPGGSSGGSAAAVAADSCAVALGSDTGGSIRQPAALTGTVGLKPTYGRVSRFGLIAFGSSLDQIGPIAKSVRDAALVLRVMAGRDPADGTSADREVPDYAGALGRGVEGMRLGIPKQYFPPDLSPEVAAAVKGAVERLVQAGAKTVEVDLPTSPYSIATYYIVATSEASSNLARYDGVKYGFRSPEGKDLFSMYALTRRDGFGAEVKRRIMLGTYALSAGYYDAFYKKGLQVRTLLRREFDRAFEKCDAILSPTSPFPAFKIGEKVDDPLSMYLSDIFTVAVNLAGIPGISVPCGANRDGLPIGLQVLAKPFGEEAMLRVAFEHEKRTPPPARRPAL